MIGTVQRNIFDRAADAMRAWKGLPSPSQLYPPQQNVQGGFVTFPGWPIVEAQAGGQDSQRVRKALQSVSVFSNMQAIANEFASTELIVKRRKGDKLEDVDNHPLELIWESPNPYMGRSFVMAYWAWSYTLPGKAYLYWLPAGGGLKEVWPIPPFMITPRVGGADFIDGYLFKARADAEPILIPPEYITYSHSVNLWDLRDGLSFLAAAMLDVDAEIAETLWNRNFFDEQNGVPDGLITINKDTLDADLIRIRSEIRDFFGGTRRGVAVARAGDMDYKPFGRSQKEIEFKEGLLLSSKRIDRAMGFPEGYWSETANRANAEQARATMIAGAVWPLAVRLAEDMNSQGGVIQRWYGNDYRAEFKDIRPEDRALKLQELQFYAQIETVDELRQRIGDDPLDDPRGLMLVAEITKGAPLPATPAAEATEEYLQEQEAEAGMGEEEAAPVPKEAAPPAEETAPPAEEVPVAEEVAPPTKALDLARWERKALKSLKRFYRAAVPFASDAIPLPEQVRISDALKVAQTVEEVRAAFKAAPRRVTVDALAEDEEVLKRARRLREEAKR